MEKTVKILHLAPPGFGGIDAFLFTQYKHMDRERFRFDFLTRNRGLENAGQYREFNYRVRLLPSTASEDPNGFTKYVRAVLRDGYDVFHIHTSYWTGLLLEELAREAGIKKVIVHAHSSFIDEPDEKKRAELLVRHEEIKRTVSPGLATDYWACSWTAANWLFGRQIPRERIKIMKNAIEVERFRFQPQKRERLRRELGLEDALVLGTVGRLSYQKNQAFLVDLLPKFRKKHPNAKLLIIGDGELRKALEEQVRENGLEGAVSLLGWKTNVEDYLQAMDCFLLPSRFEGLGIVIMEAAASGLPCIVSEAVPADVEISPAVCRIPLESPVWLETLEKMICSLADRSNGAGYVCAAGYDIRQQAKVLERLYAQ